MIHINELRKNYDVTFTKNSCHSYNVSANSERGSILSLCLDHSFNRDGIENLINDKKTKEFIGISIEAIKKKDMIYLYNDEERSDETLKNFVSLPPLVLKNLVAHWLLLIKECLPAITLHWENDTPVLTPWYDVDLSWGKNTPNDSDNK